MIIELSEHSPPGLVDLDRLDRLHATSSSTMDAVVWSDLCQAADDEHVWLDIAAARDIVAAHDADAVVRFDSMIEFASTRGWLSDDARHVRAHVVGAD